MVDTANVFFYQINKCVSITFLFFIISLVGLMNPSTRHINDEYVENFSHETSRLYEVGPHFNINARENTFFLYHIVFNINKKLFLM